ncbi:hypothetical protein LOTGIDRAFT_238654 [Lottia gigantea]|uniref:tRNA (guanine(10)-N(2))-methyltransferase TRMT11 n=1 Tax=Lottia gigantea TaxID=225164 RepID=V4ASG1_LOTGI|nr:hypothetical protein LOTGIDRAFT_238654 [Lottia gigantea]ESP00213.1 hypothetical protein LOTGIDRAFT_238654 [Lottia gigantea]
MAAPMKPQSLSCVSWSKYLFYFASEHLDFRLAELEAISQATKSEVRFDEESYDVKNPFLVVESPSIECIHRILSRSVLLRSIHQLLAQGTSTEELHENVRKMPKDLLDPYSKPDQTFAMRVETFNKKIPQKVKIEKIKALPLAELGFKGTVDLKNPDNEFHLFEYYGWDCNNAPDEPYHSYFGRKIGEGQRDRIQEYHLQKRHFIGNTSMDAGLSFIMSNLAQVTQNSLVLDPFVGTGSLLVSAAHYGGYVMGTEIDYLVLHAKGKPSRSKQKVRAIDESIHANLKQYGLESHYIDVIVADSSKQNMWRDQSYFDAIITDPPYGIREPAKKIRAATEDYIITDDMKDCHYPQKEQYELTDIFIDLLNFAAKYLQLYGRLVYWFPVIRAQYSESNIPQHPCFKLIANCEQPLSMKVARRLITMEKIHPYKDDTAEARIDIDHFQGSFRQKYFHKEKEIPNKTNPS